MSATSSTATTFDTHATVKRLISAGASEPLAEAIVDAVQPATVMPDVSQLASKDDIRILEAKMGALEAKMGTIKGQLVWWILGTGAALGVSQNLQHFFGK